MKLRFSGFVRGLLGGQRQEDAPARSVTVQAPPAAPAKPTSQAKSVSTVPVTPPPVLDASNSIQLPLAPIVSALPMDLKAKLMAFPNPSQSITLSAEAIVGQLAFGSVKISFGELRRLSPGTFANSGGEHDKRPINLPLQEILSRINPALLARRSTQKVEVADEVAGPFEGRGRGVSFTTQPLRPEAAPAAPVPDPNQPIAFTPPQATPAPTAPAPRAVTPGSETETFSFTPRQITPTPPIAFTPLSPNAPAAPPPAKPPVPPHTNGNNHGNGNGNGNGNGHHAANLPPFKFSTTPSQTPPIRLQPAPAPMSVPDSSAAQVRIPPAIAAVPAAAPVPLTGNLTLTLDDLSENWPEEIKTEILNPNLMNASIVLSFAAIEPGLKRGRVTMTWKELRTLARPSSTTSVHDGVALDLPLKILAPAFLSAQKKFKQQTKVVVNEEIPNLFFGFPQAAPEPAAPSAPTPMPLPGTQTFTPAPTAAPLAAFVPFTAAKAADTNFFPAAAQPEIPVRTAAPNTDFTSRMMHPKDVVGQAVRLPGVAGAVVTLADGLRVASEIPADMNPDTVSAFLPQIYERVNQSTRELRMGALNNVSFTVGNVAWKIFRVNSIYFAAFTQPGQSLPKAQLAQLAAELDRKK